jgi:hypothetical protein
VPGACAAAPDAPTNLLAYVAAGVTNLLWDPPAAGAAPLSYQLAVPGFGVFPMATRSISGPLPRGNYTIEVRSVGACGVSAPAVQVLTVP